MSTASSSSLSTLFRERFPERVLFNEPLGKYLAYEVGGPADILVFPETEADLIWITDLAQRHSLPVTVVGRGTNLLVRDEGIRGITVSLARAFGEIEWAPGGSEAEPWVKVGGGVTKDRFLAWAIEQGLTGLEFSAGVPGTIGGGIYMNAGTKYGCYGDILKELRIFDFKQGPRTADRESLHFGYREQNAVKDSLVVWATFALRRGDAREIQKEVDRIIEERAAKQPLDFPSCGSTFKNPPGYSAGRLIEKAGLKGLAVGGAQVSEKHANFILNKNKATASDILHLIDTIKARVKADSGVALECEVIVLGDTPKDASLEKSLPNGRVL